MHCTVGQTWVFIAGIVAETIRHASTDCNNCVKLHAETAVSLQRTTSLNLVLIVGIQ